MDVQLSVPDLLDSAARLDNKEFESFFKEMLSLRAKRIAPVLSEQENMLLQKIYTKLPSKKTELYETLSEKRRLGTISKPEYNSLLELIGVVEQHNVERLGYIVELATLRQVTPQKLMEQLGLMPLHNG